MAQHSLNGCLYFLVSLFSCCALWEENYFHNYFPREAQMRSLYFQTLNRTLRLSFARTYLIGNRVGGRFGLQAGRCFQVLTKAVGMSEYGTVVMLFQASKVGS